MVRSARLFGLMDHDALDPTFVALVLVVAPRVFHWRARSGASTRRAALPAAARLTVPPILGSGARFSSSFALPSTSSRPCSRSTSPRVVHDMCTSRWPAVGSIALAGGWHFRLARRPRVTPLPRRGDVSRDAAGEGRGPRGRAGARRVSARGSGGHHRPRLISSRRPSRDPSSAARRTPTPSASNPAPESCSRPSARTSSAAPAGTCGCSAGSSERPRRPGGLLTSLGSLWRTFGSCRDAFGLIRFGA